MNFALLILCTLVVLWLVLSNLGHIWKIIYGSIIGMVTMILLGKAGIYIGINAVTCLICGVLGVPGFVMLFLLKALV